MKNTSHFAFIALMLSSLAQGAPGEMIQATHPESADDAKVGSYVSSENGFSTATFWIEGPEGLILLDTQFLRSAAVEAIQTAEKYTGKKALAAFVLHPNPDKFNGTEVFKKHGIRVLTSSAILQKIPAVHRLRKSWFFERFKPDYPEDAPEIEALNERLGEKTRKMSLAGTEITLHFLGPGCSDHHLAIEWKKHLFVGDLVTNNYHSWLELGRVDAWIARIQELQRLAPDWVHPGRGPSGSDSLLVQELHYLKTVRQIVRTGVAKAHTRKQAQVQIEDQILKSFPGYRNSLFVSNGVEALVEHAWPNRNK